MQSIQLADFDRDALRTRLRKMSDEELQSAIFRLVESAIYGRRENGDFGQTPEES
jgi:hypothetical protein